MINPAAEIHGRRMATDSSAPIGDNRWFPSSRGAEERFACTRPTLDREAANRVDPPDVAEKLTKRNVYQVETYSPAWREMIVVARQGIADEPGNAFFPLLAARLESAMGLIEECKADLAVAAKCSFYNDRWQELQDLLARQRELRFGYRGEWAKVVGCEPGSIRYWMPCLARGSCNCKPSKRTGKRQ